MPAKRKICLVYALPALVPANDDIYAILWHYASIENALAVQVLSQVPFNRPDKKSDKVVEISHEIEPEQYIGLWSSGRLLTDLLRLNDAELCLDGLLEADSGKIREWDPKIAQSYADAIIQDLKLLVQGDNAAQVPLGVSAKYQ